MVTPTPEHTGTLTPHQVKFFAHELTLKRAADDAAKLTAALMDAQVDLNPHQVDAALFAFKSPLSKGAILADEVGLGKTIEAGLVVTQKWAEGKRRILVICPSSLRAQWRDELGEKFFLPADVIESKTFNAAIKHGETNPFDRSGAESAVLICSFHFAANKELELLGVPWDLVVIDEAHRLRNVYKPDNKIGRKIRGALANVPKVLLTATPLQNSLMELYGLVSFVDEHAFGDAKTFRSRYSRVRNDETFTDLKSRLAPLCHRTLRRQVTEYVKYTNRVPLTQEFVPTSDEQVLYDLVSEYLRRPDLHGLPNSQRALITLVLRKLLASSTFAIAGGLDSIARRLGTELRDAQRRVASAADREDAVSAETDAIEEMAADVEHLPEIADEWTDEEESTVEEEPPPSPEQIAALRSELAEIEALRDQAVSITENAKGTALISALEAAFAKARDLGASEKAIIFTESRRTQNYLVELLAENGYAEDLVLFNGSNNDDRAKEIYKAWTEANAGSDRVTGTRTADIRSALVDEFRNTGKIMIATEAAAEGVNLQFCSIVVNYDLPWNPQRIEQRIGRCHRYGQKHDVVVVNFLNKKNAADQRVYELLAKKFHLFDGVFGSSDQVLGALESGVDVERRIAEIYQDCRTQDDIARAFTKLQTDLEEQIQDRLAQTRQLVLDYFDEEVHERLRVHRDEARAALDERGRRLLALAKSELDGAATFEDGVARFHYRPSRSPLAPTGEYSFDWKDAEERGAHFFRTDHPLAQALIERSLARQPDDGEVVFDYHAYGAPVAILAERLGQGGWLRATKVTVKSIEEEEHLLMAAIVDASLPGGVHAEALDAEWCDRLLNLPGKSTGAATVSQEVSDQLDELIAQEHAAKLEEIETRNGKHFEEEVDKLDRWAEDMKLTLERELKELDAEIWATRRDSKTKVVLADKLEAQRRIKTLEQRRNSKRRQLFDAQDDVDKKRIQLIEDIESQLKTSAERETLFTIRWALPEAPRN